MQYRELFMKFLWIFTPHHKICSVLSVYQVAREWVDVCVVEGVHVQRGFTPKLFVIDKELVAAVPRPVGNIVNYGMSVSMVSECMFVCVRGVCEEWQRMPYCGVNSTARCDSKPYRMHVTNCCKRLPAFSWVSEQEERREKLEEKRGEERGERGQKR